MSESLLRLLFLGHLASTLVMVGVIWFVQVVHYPLFARVGPQQFPTYESTHIRLTKRVVFPPMVLELGTAIALLIYPLPGIPPIVYWLGFLLLALIWGSTFVFQVPLHRCLTSRFDDTAQFRLVLTNWIRTVAWSVRGCLVLGILMELLK